MGKSEQKEGVVIHPPYEYSTYFNMNAFVLSIVIVMCIILSITTCMLIWFKDVDKTFKYSATYLVAILLIYQMSSLLSFYSPLKQFEILIIVKMAAAFLLKSAVLIWMAVYIKARKLTGFFLAIHLVSLITLLPFFAYAPFRDAIVNISTPHVAIYEDGARIYTIISSIVFIIAGILFYTTNTHFRLKIRYLIFLLLFVLLNTGVLAFETFSSENLLYERMHIFILLVLLAVFFRSTPFFDKKDWILSSANLMQGVGETAVILDRQSKIRYSHNGIKNFDIAPYFDEVEKEIEKQKGNCIQRDMDVHENNESWLEGEIHLLAGKNIHLQYKLTPLYYRKVYAGKIIVLRDISAYTEVVQKLNEKNHLLQEAFKKQEEYIRVTRRISGEEERGKILGKVNTIASNYLKNLKLQIFQLDEAKTDSGSNFKERVKLQNEEMLLLTRKMIDEARQSVRQLNIKEEEQEAHL